MTDIALKYIIDWRKRLVAILPDQESTLVFIPEEKRWGMNDRSWSQIVGASTYESGRDYDDITHERAKEIYEDCPPDEWLMRESETHFCWYVRITPESEKERRKKEKKRINIMELQVIGEETYWSDNERVRVTTTKYKCPCGKGTFIYTKEHTGFDDWYTTLNCDECKNNYFSV